MPENGPTASADEGHDPYQECGLILRDRSIIAAIEVGRGFDHELRRLSLLPPLGHRES